MTTTTIRETVERLTAAFLVPCFSAVVAGAEPAATPQRLSLSTSAWTVPRGLFELETGAGWSEGYPEWSVTVGWTLLFAGDR